MSLPLKAFPHGRPNHRARTPLRALAVILTTFLALVAALLPLAGPSSAAVPAQQQLHQQAGTRPAARPGADDKKKQKREKLRQAKIKQAQKKAQKRAQQKLAKQKLAQKKLARKLAQKKKKQQQLARARARAQAKARARANGQPPRMYLVPATSYFTYPNGSSAERTAIRSRVLKTINSTWGGRRTSIGTPKPGNGTIRIATWSFDDWDIAHALVAARKRGVSVQVIAAKQANKDHAAWHWLRKRLGQKLARPGYPGTDETVSFARSCAGACRGPGGTAHAKYFLFHNVGRTHESRVTFQTSSNLTYMAWQGQWNQAQVYHSPRVYDDFMNVFRQARQTRSLLRGYHVAELGQVTNYFFPRPRSTPAQDPVMQVLDHTRCQGSTTPGLKGRTKIRVDQYAIYGDRGVWIAKKLRALWKAGCDVAIIYSVSSRPVLAILRNPTGRGPIPMRQSVVTDSWGTFVKYNHSKWMTIIGSWGSTHDSYQTFSGSANWADLAFGDDEQMQRISSVREALRHNANFSKTWRERSSSEPTYGRASFGRGMAPNLTRAAFARSVPENEPPFGTGIYRYMTPD